MCIRDSLRAQRYALQEQAYRESQGVLAIADGVDDAGNGDDDDHDEPKMVAVRDEIPSSEDSNDQ